MLKSTAARSSRGTRWRCHAPTVCTIICGSYFIDRRFAIHTVDQLGVQREWRAPRRNHHAGCVSSGNFADDVGASSSALASKSTVSTAHDIVEESDRSPRSSRAVLRFHLRSISTLFAAAGSKLVWINGFKSFIFAAAVNVNKRVSMARNLTLCIPAR